MTAYYNENDTFAAAWLRELIKAKLIAPGIVDSRPIQEVTKSDVKGFTQCHFFAGIGVWSYALRQAGWSDRRPVWTGSCPCQPFSASGQKKGFKDDRHLWPTWSRLIAQCHPPVVFGEQVASPDGLKWFDLVSADLEGAGYVVGAADLCAAGVGAPHIRQRLWFVADGASDRWRKERAQSEGRTARDEEEGKSTGLVSSGARRQLAESGGQRCKGKRQARPESKSHQSVGGGRALKPERAVASGDVGHSNSPRLPLGPWTQDRFGAIRLKGTPSTSPSLLGRAWAKADWLWCRDNKARPVESSTFPLVDGAPARVGRLRGYGNALCAPVAEIFIRAFMGCR